MLVLERAKYIYHTEGLSQVIMRGLEFLTRFVFQYDCYYIFETRPKTLDEQNYKPTVPNYVLKIIGGKGDIEGIDPLINYVYRKVPDAKDRIDKGAVAFCIFIGKTLANVGWVAMNEEAHKAFFQPPYVVNFAAGEASTLAGWTDPAYRSTGLATYNYFKRLQFMWDSGVTASHTAVGVNNIPSLKMHIKFGSVVRAKGCLLKLLWYRLWRETPINMELSKLIGFPK